MSSPSLADSAGPTRHLPTLGLALLVAFVALTAWRLRDDTTLALVASSVTMFACCAASALHLLGRRATVRFVAIAVVVGWFAEQMGASHGWFFGQYRYTEVLGPKLGDVPVVIPLMWFSLVYTGFVLANLIVWQTPVDPSRSLVDTASLSLLAALIVTAFDLGADPYFVFQLKAWIMTRTDGDWFGETVQGFVGWVVVSFAILGAYRLTARRWPSQPVHPFTRRHALVPLGIYAAAIVFQAIVSRPVELRTVAVFAMGIPLLSALAGFRRWTPGSASSPP